MLALGSGTGAATSQPLPLHLSKAPQNIYETNYHSSDLSWSPADLTPCLESSFTTVDSLGYRPCPLSPLRSPGMHDQAISAVWVQHHRS